MSYRAIQWPDKLLTAISWLLHVCNKEDRLLQFKLLLSLRCIHLSNYIVLWKDRKESLGEGGRVGREGGWELRGYGGGSWGSKRKINTAPSTEGGLAAFPQTLNPICKLPPKPVSCSTNLILIFFGGKCTLNKEANINNCDDVCTEFAESWSFRGQKKQTDPAKNNCWQIWPETVAEVQYSMSYLYKCIHHFMLILWKVRLSEMSQK